MTKMAESSPFFSDQGPVCFKCRGWRHKSQECTKKVNAAKNCRNDWPGTVNLHWNVLHGRIRNNDCEVEIDSVADVSIVAKDLVPQANYTDRHVDIEGVTGEIVEALIAKVLLQFGERKLWVEAAVLDNTNKDVLLVRDNDLQFELLAEAMDAEQRERNEQKSVLS